MSDKLVRANAEASEEIVALDVGEGALAAPSYATYEHRGFVFYLSTRRLEAAPVRALLWSEGEDLASCLEQEGRAFPVDVGPNSGSVYCLDRLSCARRRGHAGRHIAISYRRRPNIFQVIAVWKSEQ